MPHKKDLRGKCWTQKNIYAVLLLFVVLCDLEASLECLFNNLIRGFPSGSLVMNLPASAGDMSSIPVQEDPTCCETAKLMGHKY